MYKVSSCQDSGALGYARLFHKVHGEMELKDNFPAKIFSKYMHV